MKYLSEDMTKEEARKAYRTLAKTLHPDVGGSDEEFQILADEYTTIISREEEKKLTLEERTDQVEKRINLILDTLNEVYPRTKIHLSYSFYSIDIFISTSMAFSKMMNILSIVSKFSDKLQVTMQFQRGSRKYYKLYTEGGTTYINIDRFDAGDIDPLSSMTQIYKGRRYNVYRSRKFSRCIDGRTQHVYIMHNTPKFTLMELMGIGKD